MIIKMISCCLTGHRPQNLPCGFNEEHYACIRIKTQLRKMIIGMIEKKNVTQFITGMALGSDIWAAEIVLDLRDNDKYPMITLEAAIPCAAQTSGWNVKYRNRYDRLLSLCDKETLIQERYTADCMMKRNKYMVDNSDYVVAVWNKQPSGTLNTMNYAVCCGKPVFYIDVTDFKMKKYR